MKKILVLGIAVFLLTFGLKEAHAQEISFGDAIQTATEEISISIERGARIAVLSMQADSVMMSNHLIDEMIVGFVKTNRFTVINRAQLELITEELQFNMSGFVSDETAQSIGKILGVQFIIIGVFGPVGDLYRFSIQAIEVETAAIRGVYTINVPNDNVISSLLGDAGKPMPPKPRTNWLSAEASFFGIGARYERIINNNFSIGGISFFDYDNDFIWDGLAIAILVNFRFYPGGNSLFYLELGAGLGVGQYDNSTSDYNSYQEASGFALVPAIGMKFGGQRKGVFVNPFISLPIVIGEETITSYGEIESSGKGAFVYLRYGVGLGYAW